MAAKPDFDRWGAMYPNVDRLFLLLWYIPIGIAMHGAAALSGDPLAYDYFAQSSYLPIYRQFFADIVPSMVTVFALAATVTELAIGLLIMSRGVFVKYGLLLNALLQIMLIPTSEFGIINVLLAVMGLMLLRYDFTSSLPAELADYVHARRARTRVPSA